VPVVNPDGYEYNRQTNPGGGGMWRKNRNGGIIEQKLVTCGDMMIMDHPQIHTVKRTCGEAFSRTGNTIHAAVHKFSQFHNGHEFPRLATISSTPGDISMDSHQTTSTTIGGCATRGGYAPGTLTMLYNTNGDSDDWQYGEQPKSQDIRLCWKSGLVRRF
jgi:hypothetical protein